MHEIHTEYMKSGGFHDHISWNPPNELRTHGPIFNLILIRGNN